MSDLDRRLQRLESQQGELQIQIDELKSLLERDARGWTAEPYSGDFDDPDPMRRPLRPRAQPRTVEDLATPRNLAIVGGSGVTIGLAFLVSYGISKGWISEGMRVALAAIASALLAGTGAWLLERTRPGAPAMALLLSGMVGGFLTIVAATRLYELISVEAGVTLATLVGAAALGAALRWRSELAAVFAVAGVLLAPALVGAEYDISVLYFLLPAFAFAMAISGVREWPALFGVGLVGIVGSIAGVQAVDPIETGPALLLSLTVSLLSGVGLLYRAVVRGEAEEWLPVAYGLAASIIAAAGFVLVRDGAIRLGGGDSTQDVWLFVFAAMNAGLVLRAHSLGLVDLRRAALTAATASSAWGLGEVLHGPALVISWSAAAAITLLLAREDWELVIAAGFASLAAGHVLFNEIPPDALGNGVDSLGDAWIAGFALIATAALAWGYGIRAGSKAAAMVVAGLGIYLLSITIVDISVTDTIDGFAPDGTSALDSEARGQVAVSCLWAVSGLAFVLAGLRWSAASWRTAGLGLLALAGAKIVIFDLSSLTVAARTISFIVVGLVFLVAAFAYQVVARRASAAESD